MNQNNDYIPEGFEFKDEYMNKAFLLYDKEKKKKRIRRILFFLNSFLILGCISLNLLFFINEGEKSSSISHTKNDSLLKNELKNSNYSTISAAASTLDKNLRIVKNEKPQKNVALKTPLTISEKSIDKISKTNIKHAAEITKIEKTSSETKLIPQELNQIFVSNTEATNNDISPKVIEMLPEKSENIVSNFKSNGSLEITNNEIVVNEELIRVDTLVKEELKNEAQPESIDPNSLENIFFYKTHQFWASTGVNSLYNYSTNHHKLNSDYSFGLGYTYNNHSRLSFGGSLEFYSVSNMAGSVEIIDKIYGYRSSYRHTSITTKSLQYLSIKPTINYAIWGRHQLSLSYNLDILTSSTNTISTKEVFSDYTEDYGSQKVRNFNQGFNRFNHAVALGYICNINKRFALGINYNYGFTDITNKSYFTNLTFDRNSRLLFYLKVNIN